MMPQFILVTPIPEVVEYRELIEAECLEEAEEGKYTIVKELKPNFTGEHYEVSELYRPYIEEIDETVNY